MLPANVSGKCERLLWNNGVPQQSQPVRYVILLLKLSTTTPVPLGEPVAREVDIGCLAWTAGCWFCPATGKAHQPVAPVWIEPLALSPLVISDEAGILPHPLQLVSPVRAKPDSHRERDASVLAFLVTLSRSSQPGSRTLIPVGARGSRAGPGDKPVLVDRSVDGEDT